MALSTLAKEQENFLRYAILVVDHSKEALQDLVELNLKNKHLTFNEFLNQNQHDIYHLCYDSRCCQCQNTPPRRKRIIFPSQLELLFDKYKKLHSHTAIGHNDFCCSYAKVGITSQVLDLSLARCLLVNCCLDVYWFTCLTAQGQTFEQFLNCNKHIIYHFWKNNQNCCQCLSGFIFPCDSPIIDEDEWRSIYSSVLLPCINDRKRTSTGTTSVCSVAARPGIDVKDIPPDVQRKMLKWCCSVSDSVEKLVEFRNVNFGHITNAKLSDSNFKVFSKKTEECILHIASFCKKDQIVKDVLTNLHSRPIDARLCSHYQNLLLEYINRNEAIYENIELQHRNTRKSIPGLVDKSCKMRKMEKRIDDLEASNAKIKEDIHDIHKLVKEGPTRQRLLDRTSAEIESHVKDGAYIEIEATKHCIQLLERRNVVILSGREGSGKSRNGLEILRHLRKNNKDSDVFKLTGLTYLSDIIKCNVISIVLFDDAFHNTFDQVSNTKHILDHLYSYVTLNEVKLIFTMRNAEKIACQMLTHKLFHDMVDIDLNSKTYRLTIVEKEKMLTNYCDINKIKIFEGTEDTTDQSVFHEVGVADKDTIQTVSDQVSVFVNREMITEIIQTDPFLGFPECCRLFTEHRNNTTLDVTIFKWPSHTLVKDIEKWRIEGKHDSVNGLKYVALICILSMGKSHDINEYYLGSNFKTVYSLHEKNIDVKVCNEIFQECCNKNSEVYEHDIKYALDELVAGCYLVKKDGTYYFQHPALKDAVLVSYGKINTKAIIPLLSFDHMMDLVKLQNYSEQENEIFVRIDKKYYHDLAIHFISLVCHRYSYRLIEYSTFAKNDIDFIHQLLLCFNDKSETSLMLKSIDNKCSKLLHYFPLCLLQNIGELDDNKLTANHTKDHLLISMVIEGQTITFTVDPSQSLQWAFQDKNERIVIWLAKNTDHSLLKLEILLYEYILGTSFGSIPLLLQNFDHIQFDMTTLLSYVCICCFNKANHIIDWMMDNINNSLINYDTMFENDLCVEVFDSEKYFNLILYIRNKVNRKLFDVSKAVQMWYIYWGIEIVQRVMQDGDNKILDEEELIDILIDYNEQERYINMHGEHSEDNEQIVEQLLQTTGVKYHDLSKLVGVASDRGWLNVLELIFKHDADKSLHTVKVIKDTLQQPGKDACSEETIRLIMKYYVDYIDVNILMKKAIDCGFYRVVKELFLKKVDNISYYLDITLDKLRHQQLNSFLRSGNEKILLLFLKKINTKCIDLNSVMNDVCHIGHSSAILWLLENKNSHCFDLRNVMNKASYHGDRELVKYLKQNYKAGDFNYKTAMIKACRNSREKTLDVCKWLWGNIDRDLFDMKVALNNASRCDNIEVVEWILTDVDMGLLDIESAVLCASEHGEYHTVKLLLDKSRINTFNFQHAITLACKNENDGYTIITQLLYERADKSIVDMNDVFSAACKNYRSDIVQWMIVTCDQHIPVNKTRGSPDKNMVDKNHAIVCILDMNDPNQKREREDKTKIQLLWLILKQSDPDSIDVQKLLKESCKRDWVQIFKWIQGLKAFPNIHNLINVACQQGAYKTVKWSLENIDLKLIDVNNVMVESCGYGWLECLVLVQKHCYQCDLHAAMVEACNYGHLHIVEWLLQNFYHGCFNLLLLLKEAGRNGWINVFVWLVDNYVFKTSNKLMATKEALVNGKLGIVKLMFSRMSKSDFDISDLPEKTFTDSNNEEVVSFLLHHCDPKKLDISTIMKNACKFGWTKTVQYILDENVFSSCDLNLAFAIACENGESEIVKALADKCNLQNLKLERTMISICIKGWDEVALFVLDKFEHTRLDIANALIEACRHGEIDVAQAILRKVKHTLLDVKTALDKACENHMHEKLVLLILENSNQKVVDLKNVKKQAIRYKWREVQFAIHGVDTENLNEAEQDTDTDFIAIS